ncbi:MAG: hypothetical protein JXR23_02655 [Pontiellaceae bacterium]|nr:hypothetical protein [Pontiellaceae bacterium]
MLRLRFWASKPTVAEHFNDSLVAGMDGDLDLSGPLIPVPSGYAHILGHLTAGGET